jgi:WD40 repeat protein
MKMKTRRIFDFIMICCITSIGCENPAEFKRVNTHDPENPSFVPDAPTNITIRTSNRKIMISWQDNSDYEDGYLIERALDDTVNFTELAKLPSNATTFADTIDFNAFAPIYRVSAFNANGLTLSRLNTRAVSITLFKPNLLLFDFVNEQQIKVSWQDVIPFETGFELERQVGDSAFTKIVSLPANTVEYSDHLALINNANYNYRIRAVKNSQYSPYETNIPKLFAISTPDSLNIHHLSSNGLVLFWRQYSKLTSAFIIERSHGQDFVEIGRVAATAKKFQDTTLDSSRSYQYRVKTLVSWPSTPVQVVYKKNMYVAHTFAGHTDQINAVAFSPAGQMLATCSSDRTAKLWDTRSGRLLRTIQGPTASMNSVDFSPDGQLLATGSGANNCCPSTGAKLWDVQSGSLIRTVTDNNIYRVKFSPDGRYIAAGGGDVALYQVATGQVLVSSYNDSTAGLHGTIAFAFSPDGKILAAGDSYGRARLFEAETGRLIRRLPAGSYFEEWQAIMFNPDGNILATGAGGDVNLWETNTGRLVRNWTAYSPGLVSSLAFNSIGNTLVTSSRGEKAAKLWDVNTGNLIYTLEVFGHGNGVGSVAYSPDNQTIATGSWDRTAKLWREGSRWVVDP